MSFRLRLMVIISLLVAIVFGIGGTVLIAASFHTSLGEDTTAALDSFESVRNTLYLLNSLTDQTDHDSLADALDRMKNQGIIHCHSLSLKAGDMVIYQSGTETFSAGGLPEPAANACAYMQVKDELGWGLLVKGILQAEEQTLVLEARFDLSAPYTARRTQQKLFFWIYGLVVALSISISGVLAFMMTARLERLTAAVRRISGGDLSVRSNVRSADEFGQLSRDFDTMADKLQENIGKLQEEMQRQEAFMGAFAHELKTPMTSIIGYADLLRQGDMDESTRMIAANYIFSEGQRLEKLSFKLLELLLLEKDTPAMREVNLPVFLQEIDKALQPVLREKNIRFVCRSDRGRAVLEPDLVKSLLYNLVDNASKAMDSGGVIGLKATPIPGGCQFQVVDNGRGMEAKELEKITGAFYRVDKSRSRKQGGAGLGLALCKRIVELHGGTMVFTSEPGTGTRVTVTLYGKEGG